MSEAIGEVVNKAEGSKSRRDIVKRVGWVIR